MTFFRRAGLTGTAASIFFIAIMAFRTAPSALLPSSAQPSPTATTASESSQSSILKKKWQEEGPWRASRQHFAGIQTEKDCPPLEGKEISNPRSDVWCIPDKDVLVRAMIAIVPDPVHSHLSLAFDRTIEAIQLAADNLNYEMDRYWLPWRTATQGSSGTAEPRDATREKEPGLLLFRWNGSANATDPKILYVFLVSDTSTAGVNGSQFSNAVQYVQQVCGQPGKPGPCGKDNPILMMGPTFSGSLASLRDLTNAATSTSNAPDFTAYSGTISSICAIKNQGLLSKSFATNRLPSGCKDPAPAPPLKQRLTVTSLVGDSETMVQEFIQQLQSNGNIDCKSAIEVAILSEAATAYGGSTVIKVAGRNNTCPYTSFRYPREISNLRNASASSNKQPAAAPAQPGEIQTPDYLPFTLADQQPNFGDEPADFSQAQGPLSKESVMMKYAAELRREHYKYVGIIGTNVVDVLYLAKFLRSACPDVRLFVLNSDLLFERDLDNAPYIGTLSISTYPLLGHDPEWHDPRNLLPRLPFADQFEQGIYNAALLAMSEALQTGVEPRLRDTSEPFLGTANETPKSGVLPVWVTAVGTGGYWPVQLIPPQAVNGTPQAAAVSHLDSDDFSPAWRAFALFLTGFAFLMSWILWAVPVVRTRFRDYSLLNEAPPQRFFFISLASASLACTLALFMMPALKFGMSADRIVAFFAILMLLAIATLIACNLHLWRLLKMIRRTETSSDENRYYHRSSIFSFLAWVGAALAAGLWWNLLDDSPSHYGFFFSYRSINLASGVSPLTPLLLLFCAVFLWCLCEIRRLRFGIRLRPRLTRRSLPGTVESNIADSINDYLLRPDYMVIFILVFAGWLFFLQPVKPFELFEKTMFGWVYEMLFIIVVALMLSSGLRLAQTWQQLQDLLRKVERSPVRGFFSRLKEASWSPIWQAGGQQAEWTDTLRSIEVIQKISSCNKESDTELGKNMDATLHSFVEAKTLVGLVTFNKTARKAGSPAENPIADYRRLEKLSIELQDFFVAVLDDILRILEDRWKNECYEPAGLDQSQKEDPSVLVKCCKDEPDEKLEAVARLEEYVALRFVAFIRRVLGNIRWWLILQAAVFSLVLGSLNVYSFEPHRALVWSFTALFVLIGAIAVVVLMQVHKNPVISRITGTKPNKLDLQFFVRIATLGIVPLFTLLATHFPSIGHYLLSIFQPGLDALK